jgi:hypothetical protein
MQRKKSKGVQVFIDASQFRRKQPKMNLNTPRNARKPIIHPQCFDCRPANRCDSAAGTISIQRKMLLPSLLKRVKQSNRFSALWIRSGSSVGFAQAARGALQCQVTLMSRPPLASWNDMVDMKNRRLSNLYQMAVLATSLIARKNSLAKRLGNSRQTHRMDSV